MSTSSLIHSNESQLIDCSEIHDAVSALVERLSLSAGSTDGFDIYKVVETYFTDLDMRYEINALLDIPQDENFYEEEFESNSHLDGEVC
ncbi:MAG: hypothetical protein LUD02_02400 [Tannerellaceae bacterium]|nr:hypothetical protein [Tannerellaceae bacterium]